MSGDKKRILIVDDEPEIVGMFQMRLESEDYEVFTAASAVKAIDWLRENSVDLVLTDLKMPQMSGQELLESIKRKGDSHPPKVFLISGSAELDLELLYDIGAEAVLYKPVSLKTLTELIAKEFAKTDSNDDRSAERFDIQMDVTITSGENVNGPMSCHSTNLGRGGLFIAISEGSLPPTDSHLELSLSYRLDDQDHHVEVSAVVAWGRLSDQESGPRGIGCRFEEATKGKRELYTLLNSVKTHSFVPKKLKMA